MPAGAVDFGPVPSSQPVTLTLHLAPDAEHTAALMQFLTDVQTPGSPSYKHWLTPADFAQQFGATASQLAEVQAFAASNGFTVGAVSPSGLRVTLTGSAAQIQNALAPSLHQVQVGGVQYFANTAAPTLPQSLSSSILNVDGMSTVPAAHPLSMLADGSVASLSTISDLVDANSVRLIALNSSACVEDVSPSEQAAMQMALRQATAQGMMVVAQSGCNGRGSAAYPGAFSEVTAVAVTPGITPATDPVLTELRPAWQLAVGLPADGFRHEPDLTVSSLSALSQTLMKILAEQPPTSDGSAVRLGNINQTLYQLATAPGLYTQPDDAAVGAWEAATGLGNVDLKKLAQLFPHGSGTATLTTLNMSTTNTTYGSSITFNIAVTDTSGNPVSLSGTESVKLNIGSGSQDVTISTSGVGSLTTSQLTAGTYSVTVDYSADGTYLSSSSTAQSLTIAPYPITLSATLPGTATFGQTFSLAVTAQGIAAEMPTGTITVTESGTATYTPLPQSLSATSTSGLASTTLTLPALQAGTVALQITCTMNSTSATNYSCASSTLNGLLLTIGKGNVTSNTLTLSPTAPVYGSQTALTATFGSASTTPYPYPAATGYVTITDTTPTQSNQNVGGGNLSGSAVTVNSSTISGTVNNALTATYPGDSNYNASTATATLSGTKISTTLAVVTPARTTIATGGQVTLSATLTLAQTNTSLPPTGTVQFYSNGAQIGAAVLVSSGTGQGTGSIVVTSAPITLQTVGTDAITATYIGDTNYATSTSTNPVSLTVGPATTIALTSSATGNIALAGSVTITATINTTPNSGSTVPTGSINVTISGGGYSTAVTQTATISSTSSTAATAATTFTLLPAGSYSVTATCGTTNFDCSTVTVSAITVTVAKGATTTTVVTNPSNPTAGQTVTLTATVVPATVVTGDPTITGTVTFYDNGTQLGSPAAVSGGIATYTGTLAGTNDTIAAVYSGDSNYLTSTGTSTVKTTAPVTTTTGLTASSSTALAGANIVFTASVGDSSTTTNSTPGTPAGTVTFYDTYNGQQVNLGTATLVASGPYLAIGQIGTTGLLPGAHSIVAVFGGSSAYVTSTSAALPINIYDYSVSFLPATLTLQQGNNASAVATVTAINGFQGQVVLSCTPPAGSDTTCSFNPSTVTISGSSQLLITTMAPQAVKSVQHAGMKRVAGGTAFAILLFGFLLPGVRRRRPALLAVLVSALLFGSLGCTNLVNNGAGSGSSGNGTPKGTMIFTVSTAGTDGKTTETHDTQFQVTVQ